MKKFILITIFLAMTGTVFAQMTLDDIDDYLPDVLISWGSPTSAATNGLFTSEADDFIDPSYYNDVEFEKFFAMTSFADTKRVNMGFATKIKDLYIGAYYGGKFLANKTEIPYSEQNYYWKGKNKNGVKVYRFEDAISDINKVPFLADSKLDNEGSILIGAIDMGFRLSFFSSYQSFKDNDFGVSIKDPNSDEYIPTSMAVKSVQFETGDITPQIAWGMAKDLTNNGIRPYAFFQLGFHREYGKYQTYGGAPNYEPADEEIATSANYIVPVFGVGLGGFTFYTKDEFELSADLDYVLTIVSAGDNEYNYTDSSDPAKPKRKIKTFKGINDKDDGLKEFSLNSHFIAPSLNGSWNEGNLSFAFRLGLDFGITNAAFTGLKEHSKYNDGTLAKYGADGTLSAVIFEPSLALAAQWQIASKLALNIGGYLAPGTITRVTTETLSYVEDTPDPGGSDKIVKTTYGKAQSLLTLGAKLNATDNLIFEAVTGAGMTFDDDGEPEKENNDISVFGTDKTTNGLLFFFQLLVSVKF
ncbi:MAG: hypothetical protein LBQ82_09665 [Treponema sp.]|jgi:hypothetical protein|nr:hypothetical protein [Treponema sp.]